MNKLFILTICILSLCSCQQNKDKSLIALVQEWQGKEIQFPMQNPVFVNLSGDTVPLLDQETSYKVLMYIDSIGCTTCKFKLAEWKKFINVADSICRGDISFYFIITPNNLEQIKYKVKRENFTYPICYDLNGEMNKINNFPKKIDYQTFLLSNDNRVIAIGNPINNPNIRELYLSKLGYNSVIIDKKPKTAIEVDTKTIKLGEIPLGNNFEQNLKIKNIGNNPFVIYYASTSCDCTNVEYDWKSIPAKDSGYVNIQYKADAVGEFTRSIMIYGNIPQKSISIDIEGTVVK